VRIKSERCEPGRMTSLTALTPSSWISEGYSSRGGRTPIQDQTEEIYIDSGQCTHLISGSDKSSRHNHHHHCHWSLQLPMSWPIGPDLGGPDNNNNNIITDPTGCKQILPAGEKGYQVFVCRHCCCFPSHTRCRPVRNHKFAVEVSPLTRTSALSCWILLYLHLN
jgi:hypothetical protein